MSNESCPVCHGTAMTKLAKVFAFTPAKCSFCGQNLRLARKGATALLIAICLFCFFLVFSFRVKAYIAFGIAGVVFLPWVYFIPLEARK